MKCKNGCKEGWECYGQCKNNDVQAETQEINMKNIEKCRECGSTENLKRGWTNDMYCSEFCEKEGVSRLHASMPGGRPPYTGWLPIHVKREIEDRWEE